MRRALVHSAAFVRAARRIVKRQPQLGESLRAALTLLEQDAFQPLLKTHKLKGELAGTLACIAGYDLRVVFELVEHEGQEVIHLLSVGTHDDVY